MKKEQVKKLAIYLGGLAIGGVIAVFLNRFIASSLSNQTPTMYSQIDKNDISQLMAVPIMMMLLLLVVVGYFIGKKVKV